MVNGDLFISILMTNFAFIKTATCYTFDKNDMNINRDIYLNKIIARRHNGMIKVITGMRRCGKSYLLFNLYADYLKREGIKEDHIIKIDLENRRNKELRDPDALLNHLDSQMTDSDMYYILLDEVQMVNEFEDVLNSFLKVSNADVYVTGSNAKFLATDIITEFRGRGDEIRVRPLSFKEYMTVPSDSERDQRLVDYMTYGGLPQVALMTDSAQKEDYLKSLFLRTYLRDIKERYQLKTDADLEELINVLASNIGGLTNPKRLEDTFRSVKHKELTSNTIKTYIDLLEDAFMLEKAMRYDIKGRKHIDSPYKYYFEDLGLRNARLNFRQTEFTHLLENLIYNELRMRGFSVDVGQVMTTFTDTETGKRKRSYLEVDFVCNRGYKRYYIQSALAMPTNEKLEQELSSLKKINDGFKKYVIVGYTSPTYQTEDGITIMSIYDFLLGENKFDD